MDRVISNHCALLLKSTYVDWGPIPFRTLDAWLTVTGFTDFVKKQWDTYNVVGCGLVMVKEKLKRLKQDLKIWNKEVFGETNKEKQRLIENISEFDKLDDQSGLNEEQKNQRSTLFAELKKVNNRFKSVLRQKSKIKWLEAGDLNT